MPESDPIDFPSDADKKAVLEEFDAVLFATNNETVEVKVAPIEYDLEQVVQRGDAAVAVHMQALPNWRVDLEEQNVELVNCAGSVWLDHGGP